MYSSQEGHRIGRIRRGQPTCALKSLDLKLNFKDTQAY